MPLAVPLIKSVHDDMAHVWQPLWYPSATGWASSEQCSMVH